MGCHFFPYYTNNNNSNFKLLKQQPYANHISIDNHIATTLYSRQSINSNL